MAGDEFYYLSISDDELNALSETPLPDPPFIQAIKSNPERWFKLGRDSGFEVVPNRYPELLPDITPGVVSIRHSSDYSRSWPVAHRLVHGDTYVRELNSEEAERTLKALEAMVEDPYAGWREGRRRANGY